MSCDVRMLGREIPVNLFDVTGVHVTKCCQLTDAVFVMLITFTFTEVSLASTNNFTYAHSDANHAATLFIATRLTTMLSIMRCS